MRIFFEKYSILTKSHIKYLMLACKKWIKVIFLSIALELLENDFGSEAALEIQSYESKFESQLVKNNLCPMAHI